MAKRVEKKSRSKAPKANKETLQGNPQKKGLIIGLSVFAGIIILAAGAYVGACAWVQNYNNVMPNTKVGQISLAGLTYNDVATLNFSNDQKLVLNCDENGQVTVEGKLLQDDTAGTALADAAIAVGRSENFWQGGANLIKSIVSGNVLPVEMLYTGNHGNEIDNVLDEAIRMTTGDADSTSWEIKDENLIVHISDIVYVVDREALLEKIFNAFTSGALEEPMMVEKEALPTEELDAQVIYDDIFTEPQNANLADDYVTIVESEAGISFDVNEAQKLIDKAKSGENVTIPLTLTEPVLTTQMLEEGLFRDVLGECSSYVSGSSNRIYNVGLAADACNGQILRPGEIFSYNDLTCPTTSVNGYKTAPGYMGGKTVDMEGGGVCQDSSTIYLAAMRADMKIVERYNHQYVCGYMPTGCDATVYDYVLDFRFENTQNCPIKIEVYMDGYTLYCRILGTKTSETTYAEMTSEITGYIPYNTVTKEDPSLQPGQEVEETSPYTGQTNVVYRNRYDADGNLIETVLESKNTYDSRDRVILVAPKEEESSESSSEGTPSENPGETTPPEIPDVPPADPVPPEEDE